MNYNKETATQRALVYFCIIVAVIFIVNLTRPAMAPQPVGIALPMVKPKQIVVPGTRLARIHVEYHTVLPLTSLDPALVKKGKQLLRDAQFAVLSKANQLAKKQGGTLQQVRVQYQPDDAHPGLSKVALTAYAVK